MHAPEYWEARKPHPKVTDSFPLARSVGFFRGHKSTHCWRRNLLKNNYSTVFPCDVVHFAGSSAYAQKIALLCMSKCTTPWTLPCKHLKNTVTDRMTPSLETGSQTWLTMSTRYFPKKRLLDVKPKDCKWLLYVVVDIVQWCQSHFTNGL